MSTVSRALRLAALAVALAALPAAAPAAEALAPAALAALEAPQALPDIVVGRADAPVTIVEYASMTCGHCAAFHKDVWPALKSKYVDTGKAKFVLREFPLDRLAFAAFMLARCAGPEKRDAVVDRLFDSQADWAFLDNPVPKLRSQLSAFGLSDADFDACLKNQALFDAVRTESDVATKALGVDSTPTFFVGGKRLGPEHSLDRFDEILAPVAK